MILKKTNIFALTVFMLPLAMVRFPLLFKAKSFLAVIQGIALLLVAFRLVQIREIHIVKSRLSLIASMLLFLFLLILSTLNSGSEYSFYTIWHFFETMIYALIMGIYLVNTETINLEQTLYRLSVVTCLMSITCLSDVLGLTEFYKYSYDFKVRTVGLLGSPNKSGLLLAFAIGFSINTIIKSWLTSCFTSKTVVLCLLACAAIGALVVSASRSGLILTLVFTLILFFNYFNLTKLKASAVLVLVIFLGTAIVLSFLPGRMIDYYRSRMASSIAFIMNPTGKEIMGASISNRIYAIAHSIKLVGEYPLFGVGPGRIKDARTEDSTFTVPDFINLDRKIHLDISAHNTFVNTFAEAGVPAGTIFIVTILLLLGVFYTKWKSSRDYGYCVLFSFFCTYIIFLFSQSILWRNNLLFGLFVPLALSIGKSESAK